MRRRFSMKIRFISLVALLLAMAGSMNPRLSRAQDYQAAALAKIEPRVLEETAWGKITEFFVVLADQADLTPANSLPTKLEKGRFVFEALFSKAHNSQRRILKLLRSRGVEHQSFYIVNAIWVRGNRDLVTTLASRPDVARIESNALMRNELELPSPELRAESPQVVEGGVAYTRAPEVWSLGYNGQGAVIGGGDTGFRYDHLALKKHYRGYIAGLNGDTYSHDYNWHDSIHAGGGICGPDSPAPCDDFGHGSHTIGTAIGDDGAGNQIGVAPGAKWIGCRNMDRGNGTPASYMECFQFFLAPYPVGGSPLQGDPSKAPDITTNSWVCPPSEGCSSATLQSALAAQRAAGILTVVSAGNSGPGCSTISLPPSIYDEAYTVGAFDHTTGTIAGFSSRGPVTADGSGRIKPDITAPGVGIRSSFNFSTTAYVFLTGTSMSTPNVAGAAALLLSARPDLRGRVDDIEGYLNETAVKVSDTSCASEGIPNNAYGNGRLDAKAAVDLALASVSPNTVSMPAIGGSSSVSVIAAPSTSPSWNVINVDPSITITSATSGTGNGLVTFDVQENVASTPRVLRFTVARRTVTINQAAKPVACSYLLSPVTRNFAAAGGVGSLNIVTDAGCAWSVSTNETWISVTSVTHGAGPAAIAFSVGPNTTGVTRKAKITVQGHEFLVKQSAF